MEFKNPHSYKESNIDDAITSKMCTCLYHHDGRRSLKQSHNYYYQIQFAMLCTEAKWCDFHLRTKVDVHIEHFPFDEEFCLSKITKLREFYFCAILPELGIPRVLIREPRDWIPSSEEWLEEWLENSPTSHQSSRNM